MEITFNLTIWWHFVFTRMKWKVFSSGSNKCDVPHLAAVLLLLLLLLSVNLFNIRIHSSLFDDRDVYGHVHAWNSLHSFLWALEKILRRHNEWDSNLIYDFFLEKSEGQQKLGKFYLLSSLFKKSLREMNEMPLIPFSFVATTTDMSD